VTPATPIRVPSGSVKWPAAAVVFGSEVRKRTEADRRLVDLNSRMAQGDEGETRLWAEFERLRSAVRAEMQDEVAAEFDRIHSLERAKKAGSVDRIISLAGCAVTSSRRWDAARAVPGRPRARRGSPPADGSSPYRWRAARGNVKSDTVPGGACP